MAENYTNERDYEKIHQKDILRLPGDENLLY
jgi:hypothetical protein